MTEITEDRKVRIEHFKNLVAMAMIDGLLDETEKGILAERADEVGLPEDEVADILANADQLKFQVPLNHIDKEEQLSDAVFMAMIDGVLHENEYQLCVQLAKRLDLEHHYVDQIIKLTKELWDKH